MGDARIDAATLADSPRCEAQRAAVTPDIDGIGQALGESFYLSSQGMGEWPTLDECVHAGKRAAKEIAETLLDAATWRSHICAVPPGDGRVVVMHRDRYDELNALAESASECEKLKAALQQIATNEMPCSACGHVHTPLPNPLGAHMAETYADPKDGHSYYPIEARDLAARALVGSVPPTPNEDVIPRRGYDYPTTAEVLRGGQQKAAGFDPLRAAHSTACSMNAASKFGADCICGLNPPSARAPVPLPEDTGDV